MWTKGNDLINEEGKEGANYTQTTQDFTVSQIEMQKLEEDKGGIDGINTKMVKCVSINVRDY